MGRSSENSTMKFKRPILKFSVDKYRKIKYVTHFVKSNRQASSKLSIFPVASQRDKLLESDHFKCNVQNDDSILNHVSRGESCVRNSLCTLKNLHQGRHRLLKLASEVHSPFGALRI